MTYGTAKPLTCLNKKLAEKIIHSCIDILILNELAHTPSNGYQMMKRIQRNTGILISSGTLYSALPILEKQGFIKKTFDGLSITKKGSVYLKAASDSSPAIFDLTSYIFRPLVVSTSSEKKGEIV